MKITITIEIESNCPVQEKQIRKQDQKEPCTVLSSDNDIVVLDLDTKVKNLLRKWGYTTVQKLKKAKDEDLLEIPLMGPYRLQCVRHALQCW